MATYIVTFSGSIEVEDESSEASAIAYVQNNSLALDELEFKAEEIIEPNDIIEDEEEYDEENDDANLYREYEGGKEDYLYDNYAAEQLEREE